MKRIYVIIFFITLLPSLQAQSISIGKIESRWRTLYQKGIEAFDKHDYENAEKIFLESISLLESNEAQNTKYHIYSLIKLGETYDKVGKHSDEAAVTNKLESVRKVLRPNSKKEVDFLYNFGCYLSNLQRFNEALTCLNEALALKDPLLQMQGEKSLLLHQIAFCHYCLGDFKQAKTFEIKCVNSDDNNTPDYQKSLAFYYYMSASWTELENNLQRCFAYVREPVLRKFSQSKATDRAVYWNKAKYFFTDFLPLYALKHPSDTLTSYAYNAALFSKGILLAAENKSTELTLNSNNPELIEQYNHYLELKKKKTRTLNEEFEMQALADVVVRYQKEHKNEYRKDFRIGWKDVQNKLKDNDVAVEFITAPNDNGDLEYLALSINKNSKAPKLTHLASFSELSSIPHELIYTTSELYNLIWGALEADLGNAQNVYFSATGIFHNTAIEYLPDEDGVSFYQKKNVYRLSSTKEIVLSKNRSIKRSTLFGGINYDTDPSVMVKQDHTIDSSNAFKPAIPIDSIDLRGTATSLVFSYLKGTMDEVDDISLIALESGIEVEVFSGDDGSETNFKQLSGKETNALHIATHGFYYANKRQAKSKTINQLFFESNTHLFPNEMEIANEDKMLTRSGLILAGANNVIKKIALPEGAQDGILHADEIANMNLSQVDLLVLSACQSGLGDIVTSEGVFGLQRGFKKAGVGSIAMSLWRVNDESTRILMTEMYRNLAANQTKREALSNAQNTLREYNGGVFNKPEYWAAFIFIDALD